jgi:DNA repair exonuclease SbcCD ATPase subunit
MKINRLRIRGAIGLRAYGDEVNIDFTRFDAGPIAIVGQNGSGKTTLMERCQPWPTFLSRKGSLAHHFYLKNSLVELEFEHGGSVYLSKFLIDPKNGKQGNTEAFLYRNGEPMNDGKIGSYENQIKHILGSPDIFFKALFQSQNDEGLSKLKAAPLKEFFNALLGLDRYPRLEAAAKSEIAKLQPIQANITGQTETLRVQIDANDRKLGNIPAITEAINGIGVALEEKQGLLTGLENKLKEAENRASIQDQITAQLKSLRAEIAELDSALADLDDSRNEARFDLIGQREKLLSALEKIQNYIQHETAIKKDVGELDRLQKALDKSVSVKEGVDKQCRDKRDGLLVINKEYQALLKDITADSGKVNRAISECEAAVESYKQKLAEADTIRLNATMLKTIKDEITIQGEKRNQLIQLGLKRDNLRVQVESHRQNIAREIRNSETMIAEYSAQASNLDIVPCKDNADYVSTCPLIKSAKEASDKVRELNAKLEIVREQQGVPLLQELELPSVINQIDAITTDPGFKTDYDYKILKSKHASLSNVDWDQQLKDIDQAETIINERQSLQVSLNEQKSNMVADYKKRQGEIEAKIQAGNQEIEALVNTLETQLNPEINKAGNAIAEIEKRLTEISTPLGFTKTDTNKWADLLLGLESAKVRLDEGKKQLVSLTKLQKDTLADYDSRITETKDQLGKKQAAAKELEAKIGEDPGTEIAGLIFKINALKPDIENLASSLTEQRGVLYSLRLLAEENVTLNNRLDDLYEESKLTAINMSEYCLLERAFGKNGLQALELDFACPEISNIATEVLQEFGQQWGISLRTVRESADGKKDIETFEIIVSSPDGICNFDDLSGGQKVWIEQALRKAVTIYLINHSGQEYKTLFQDEADGSLDPERANAFLKTTLKAHELTGAHHTLIITQRESIWRQIPQRIMLDPDKGTIETVIE